MANAEARGGFRARLIPSFLKREKKGPVSDPSEIQDGEFRQIPQTAFNEEEIARLLVYTDVRGNQGQTHVLLYEPDRGSETKPTVIGLTLFQTESDEQAQRLEREFVSSHANVVGVTDHRLPIEGPDRKYTETIYRVDKTQVTPKQ